MFLRRWQKKKAFYIILISQIVKNPPRLLIFRKNGLYWFIARFEKDLDQTDHFQATSICPECKFNTCRCLDISFRSVSLAGFFQYSISVSVFRAFQQYIILKAEMFVCTTWAQLATCASTVSIV